MKNLFKVFGIIALVAVIGFSFAACPTGDDDTTNNNNQQTQAPDVTFTLSDGTAGDNKYEITVSGAEWDQVSINSFIDHSIHDLMFADGRSLDCTYNLSADKTKVEVECNDDENQSYETTIEFSSMDADSTDESRRGLILFTSTQALKA